MIRLLLLIFIIFILQINTQFNVNKIYNIKSIHTKTHLIHYPLKEFLIKSSHNSYLEDYQIFGHASLDAIKNKIRNGVRCIELDCYQKKDKIIVAHGMSTFFGDFLLSNAIDFIDCIDTIYNNIKNLIDPFIIYLDYSKNLYIDAKYKIKQILKNKFNTRLFQDNNFYNEPIKNLFERIIVLTSDDKYFYNLSNKNVNKNEINTNFSRIYPSSFYFTSNNFDPKIFWQNHYQIVALNTQSMYTDIFTDFGFIHFSELSDIIQ